jgi:DNA repair protein RadC
MYADTPDRVAEILRCFVGDPDRKQVAAMFLDAQHQVIGMQVAAVGDVNTVHCPPTSVFKGALLSNAVSVVIAHNHPSGDSESSAPDVEMTHQS